MAEEDNAVEITEEEILESMGEDPKEEPKAETKKPAKKKKRKAKNLDAKKEAPPAVRKGIKGWKKRLLEAIPGRIGEYNVTGWDGTSAWAITDNGSVAVTELRRLV